MTSINTNGTATGDIACGNTCTHSYRNLTTTVNLTAAPDPDSDFTGWSGACTNTTGDCTVTMDASKSVTATFVLKTFTLTVAKSGTGAGTITSDLTGDPGKISCGAACSASYDAHTQVTLTAAANSNSIFTGWSGACAHATGTCVVTMDNAQSVTASFTRKPVLTVTKNGSGTGLVTGTGINCGSDCTQTYNNLTSQVTLSATPNSDSDFAAWTGCDSTNGTSCTIAMTAAKTATATFTLKTFQLDVAMTGTGSGAVTGSPGAIDCGADCSEVYNADTVVTLTAAPDADSLFTGWSGSCSNSAGDCVVTMDQPREVTATFTLKPVLTVTKAGSGSGTVSSSNADGSPSGDIDCGTDCMETYNNLNTEVTLSTIPDADSIFTGWDSVCSGIGKCVVTMDAAKTVTANFDTLLPALP